jgi:hypothetical protein
MKPPIAEVLRRISRFQPERKAAHLSGYIAWEKQSSGHAYSVRIRELESALKDVVNKQLGREIRADKKLAS